MNEKSFVREVAERADCDERRAEALTFAVFQELRDRLTLQRGGQGCRAIADVAENAVDVF